jgi:hypothetical protein
MAWAHKASHLRAARDVTLFGARAMAVSQAFNVLVSGGCKATMFLIRWLAFSTGLVFGLLAGDHGVCFGSKPPENIPHQPLFPGARHGHGNKMTDLVYFLTRATG